MAPWPSLDHACKLLGHHGICPEGLETLLSISMYLGEEIRAELKDFIDLGRKMFAPVEPQPMFVAEDDPDPKPEHLRFGAVAAQPKFPAEET